MIRFRRRAPHDPGLEAFLAVVARSPHAEELQPGPDEIAILAARIRAVDPKETLVTVMSAVPAVPARRRALAAFATATVIAGATASLAYAGDLPGAAQSTARDMLAKIGVTVPGPNANAATHPDARGRSGDAHPTGATAPDSTKGATISTLARTTTATGVDKGRTISTAASGGKSHAGNPPDNAPTSTPPASPPASPPGGGAPPAVGGSGTADSQSGGMSSAGTSIAGTASGGHSSAGSGNANH
jgi:hypothetical protein